MFTIQTLTQTTESGRKTLLLLKLKYLNSGGIINRNVVTILVLNSFFAYLEKLYKSNLLLIVVDVGVAPAGTHPSSTNAPSRIAASVNKSFFLLIHVECRGKMDGGLQMDLRLQFGHQWLNPSLCCTSNG